MGNFEVYFADMDAGTVCLGGSGATTGSSSNYLVAVGPVVDHSGASSAVGKVQILSAMETNGAFFPSPPPI